MAPDPTAKPRVAIVGRPNVGKSAIFNRLAGRRIAIVHDQPGVTRDRIAADCARGKIPFELTDTGGIGANLDDGFADQVRAEVDIAIETTDLILFTVDAREGLTSIDRELAQALRQSDKPVLLLVNKIDTARNENDAAEFSALGFDSLLAISAEHGRNFGELQAEIENRLGELGFSANRSDRVEPAAQPCSIAIVGRPNVGKSSLINAILNDERTIVSEVAGTTRDAVDVPYTRDGKNYVLIDTAGLRRRVRMDSSVEVFSAMRSERSIRRADICLLVVDASTGVVAQDRRIARTILDAHKPCIVLLNKFDLYHPEAPFHDRIEQFRDDMGEDLFFLDYAPQMAVSAKERQYIGKAFKAIESVRETAADPISTGVLNRLLGSAIERNPPPMKKGKRLKLLYATQKRVDRPQVIPVPEYLLFVNYANLLTRTYERFLEGQIRKVFPLEGLPFLFTVKSRTKRRVTK